MKSSLGLLLVIPMLIIIQGCSNSGFFNSPVKTVINKENTLTDIAVLDFSTSNLKEKYGRIIADRLTEALYMNNLKIVDRSLVINAKNELDLSNKSLSNDDIMKIGLMLKANYIIIGELSSAGISNKIEFTSYKDINEIDVHIRILSVKTAEVVGMSNVSGRSDNGIELTINKLAKELSDNISNYK